MREENAKASKLTASDMAVTINGPEPKPRKPRKSRSKYATYQCGHCSQQHSRQQDCKVFQARKCKPAAKSKTIPRGKGFEWFEGEIDRERIHEMEAITNRPDPLDQMADAIYEQLKSEDLNCMCERCAVEIKAAIREVLARKK